ncbi:MAG: hypothetical protein A3C13_00735 [Candidatus Lloydbacteria bacterium RIFCSPHIGHO2_02_FULL_50_11]|nr:MAG: hypothetical protein A3C13_00735 [Candidatus Lloydbacteria bacterium RIFCSPHIGHO2_02_FULL_50_11]
MERKGSVKRVSYDSPVVLTFALLSLLELVFGYATDGMSKIYFISSSWIGSVLYIFGHKNLAHYVGNMAFILLLGPRIEKEYGSLALFAMIVTTAVFTAVSSFLIFGEGIIGASGIVFMMVILSSMMTMKDDTIHLSFILVLLLWVGKEIVFSIVPDETSQFAHIIGGLMGGILGIFASYYQRRKHQ